MSDTLNPWDQQPDEPKEAYVRFLCFRNLGPCRSVALAAQSAAAPVEAASGKNRKKTKPQSIRKWYDDSSEWNWFDRAGDWDIQELFKSGERIQAAMSDLMLALACGALQVAKLKRPTTFIQSLGVFKELVAHVPRQILDAAGTVGADPDTPPAKLANCG
jgi:hypothetical protein